MFELSFFPKAITDWYNVCKPRNPRSPTVGGYAIADITAFGSKAQSNQT
ncbi:hypothetical protein [Nostoc sp.]